MRENALTAAEDAQLCRKMKGGADRERARLVQLGSGHVLAVVGCGKAKRATRAPARELYTGCLFRAASAWAERHADRWLIASAKFGLIDPDAVLEPYDLCLGGGREDRHAWARACQSTLAGYVSRHGLPSKLVVLAKRSGNRSRGDCPQFACAGSRYRLARDTGGWDQLQRLVEVLDDRSE